MSFKLKGKTMNTILTQTELAVITITVILFVGLIFAAFKDDKEFF